MLGLKTGMAEAGIGHTFPAELDLLSAPIRPGFPPAGKNQQRIGRIARPHARMAGVAGRVRGGVIGPALGNLRVQCVALLPAPVPRPTSSPPVFTSWPSLLAISRGRITTSVFGAGSTARASYSTEHSRPVAGRELGARQ